LLRIAEQKGLVERALEALGRLRGAAGLEFGALTMNEQQLLFSYSMLGLRSADSGATALEQLERSPVAASLSPEARAEIENIKAGWFSVFRIDRVHLDEALEVRDMLRAKKLRISERSATRQLSPGDLILGWICKDRVGTLTLEGGIAHIPNLAAEPMLSLVRMLRRNMPPLSDEQAWTLSAAELPLPLLAGILALRSDPPLPELLNTSGDPLELVTGHYRIRDRERVVNVLQCEFHENEDGSYGWVGEADVLLARFELSSNMLRVQVNSVKRLKTVQQRIEGLLGNAVERSLEAHEDVEQAVRARKGKARRPDGNAKPLQLSPELAAQLHKVVLDKIRETLDEPIPQFKRKSLRQLARSPKSRPDAISWLREQERLLRSNPQLAGLDLRPLWQELALPYQGLETDPSV
jgi:hypothetical protein